jgi:hypothetical protein
MATAALLKTLQGAGAGAQGPTMEECRKSIGSNGLLDECEHAAIDNAVKTVNDQLQSLTGGDIEGCVKKIIITICEAMQKDPNITKITDDAKEKMLTMLETYAKKDEINKYLSKNFFKDSTPEESPKEPAADSNKHDKEYLWRQIEEDASAQSSTTTIKNLSDLDAKSIMDYFTDVLCNYIRKNPGSVSLLIDSVYKRFEKYFTNNFVANIKEILEPFASQTRKIMREQVMKDAAGTEMLADYFGLSDYEKVGMTKEQWDVLKEDQKQKYLEKIEAQKNARQDALDKMLKDAIDRLMRGKPNMGNTTQKEETCDNKVEKTDAQKLQDAISGALSTIGSLEVAAGASVPKKITEQMQATMEKNRRPVTSGGRNKTRLHKQLMKRHKTLKHKLRL